MLSDQPSALRWTNSQITATQMTAAAKAMVPVVDSSHALKA